MIFNLIYILTNFQLGAPLEEDLGSWGHHFFSTSVPDPILQASAGDEVKQQVICLFILS